MIAPVLKAAFNFYCLYRTRLNSDKLLLNVKQYTTKEIHRLPEDIQPDTLTTVKQGNPVAFFPNQIKLLNHYPASFMQDGIFFNLHW